MRIAQTTREMIAPDGIQVQNNHQDLLMKNTIVNQLIHPTHLTPDSYNYSNDKLWDNQHCRNESTCCITSSPPWFSVIFSDPISNDIEACICGDESTNNEDTPIELLDIYVQ